MAVTAYFFVSALTQAQDARAHLRWTRPAGSQCPSSATLQADVVALEGAPVFVAEAQADLVLRGAIVDTADGVHVRVEARDARGALLGTREFSAQAGDCASLRRVLALMLTILIDSAELARPSHVHAHRPLVAGAGLSLWSGTLPLVRPGLSLAIAGDPLQRLRLRGYATYVLPVSARTPAGVGARFDAFALGSALCPRLSPVEAAVGLWVCAGAQLAFVYTRPQMLEGPARQLRVLGQALLELSFSLRITKRSSLEAALGVVGSPYRPEFLFLKNDHSRVFVHRPAPFGVLARFGVTIDDW
jgi:hypothetical protein